MPPDAPESTGGTKPVERTPPAPAPSPSPEPKEDPASPPASTPPAEKPAPGADQKLANYVGAEACKPCHKPEDHSWRLKGHSNAWKSLRAEYRVLTAKDEFGRACVSCHVTGYGQGKRKGFVDPADSSHLLGVQCEACHGPGSQHVEAAERAGTSGPKAGGITRKPTNCTDCHDPHIRYDGYR